MDVLIIYSETLISFGEHVSNSERMLVVHFLLTLLLLPPLRLLMARRRRFDSILPYTTWEAKRGWVTDPEPEEHVKKKYSSEEPTWVNIFDS
jgi:hypothetical protein